MNVQKGYSLVTKDYKKMAVEEVSYAPPGFVEFFNSPLGIIPAVFAVGSCVLGTIRISVWFGLIVFTSVVLVRVMSRPNNKRAFKPGSVCEIALQSGKDEVSKETKSPYSHRRMKRNTLFEDLHNRA